MSETIIGTIAVIDDPESRAAGERVPFVIEDRLEGDRVIIPPEDRQAVALALLGQPDEAMIEREAIRIHHRLQRPRWEGDDQPPFIPDSDHATACRNMARRNIAEALKLIARSFGQGDGAQ